MKNGSANLTMTYTAAAVAGTADTQALALSNISGGTFTAAMLRLLPLHRLWRQVRSPHLQRLTLLR